MRVVVFVFLLEILTKQRFTKVIIPPASDEHAMVGLKSKKRAYTVAGRRSSMDKAGPLAN